MTRFFTTRLIASFFVLYLVKSESPLDAVIDISPHPTNDSTAKKFVYFEQEKLTVKCSLRSSPLTEDVQLNLFYDIAEKNPVLGQDGLPEVESVDEKTLDVQFWPNVFVPFINFTCTSKQLIEGNWQLVSTDNLLVEQLYKTNFVKIVDRENNDTPKVTTMDSDETVELKCLADGNPQPEHYQWYNKTENGDVELADQTEAIFQFAPAADWASQSLIFCATKNKFNEQPINSAAITVISHYFPRLVLTSVPNPSNMSTLEKLVFVEEKKVIIECHLDTASPPSDIYTEIKMNNYEINPAFPDEALQYNTKDKPTTIEIYYSLSSVIPLVNISCHAVNKTTRLAKKISTILIEQEYKTNRAFIPLDFIPEVVDAGEIVKLECIADGNPKPNIQWDTYIGSKFELVNATEPVLEIITPSNRSAEDLFTCSAKNKYNRHTVESDRKRVISVYYPTPVFKTTPPPTAMSTSKKFVFLEELKVMVECTFPMQTPDDEETIVTMVMEDYGNNPVYPNKPSGIKHPKDLQIDIEFNPDKFISFVNISCHVDKKQTKERKRTTNILIEQQYKTTNVLIAGEEQTVHAGERIKLVCNADGNPKPDYQWYNKTKNTGDVKMRNEIDPVLEFVTSANWTTVGIYTCGAKNKHNLFIKKGKPIRVNSAILIPPIIKTNSTTTNSTDHNFVFFEKKVVHIICFIPLGFKVSSLFSLSMDYTVNAISDVEKPPKITKDWQGENRTLKIEYQPDSFTASISVECDAQKRWPYVTKTAYVKVEQLYKTRIVKTSGPSKVDRGKEFYFECKADGNPRPQLQWFKKTRDGFVAMINETRSFLTLKSENLASETTFMCGAKNEYNFEFVRSYPRTVTIREVN